VTARKRNPEESAGDGALLAADFRWAIAERVARSSALARAIQLRDILLYIVRQTILQPDEPIREFDIAYRILGRRHDFNPVDDNIVRVQMAHLRKKLDLYFSTEGKDEKIVITIALGNYKPVFSNRPKPISSPSPANDPGLHNEEHEAGKENAPGAPAFNQAEPDHEAAVPRSHARGALAGKVAVLLVVLALAVSCAALWIRSRDLQQSMNAMQRSMSPWRYEPAVASLWTPFLDSNQNTDIVLGDSSFLLIQQIIKRTVPLDDYLSQSYIGQSQSGAPDPNTRFTLGLIASKYLGNTSEFKLAQRFLALDPQGKNLHLYSAHQYMPSLLKADNVILIGGHISNPWQELFESRLNFLESMRFEGYGVTKVINRAPIAGEQASYTSSDSVGYCVVAYLPNSDRTGKALLIEGTSSEATEAAGDFLFSEDQFAAFRNAVHTDPLPYFEVLLKTSQVKGTPLTTTIVTYRTYPDLH